MGLKNGCYARVWSAKDMDYQTNCLVSVSKKGNDGQYKNTFQGYVNFKGDEARKKIRSLNLPEKFDKDNPSYESIRVYGSPDIETYYNKRKQTTEFSFSVWDVLLPGEEGYDSGSENRGQSKSAPKTYRKKEPPRPPATEINDDLPF